MQSAQEKIIELESKVAELEKSIGVGEDDPAKEGYKVLIKILRQQNKFLDKFEIADQISKAAKDDATYGRAKDMWENLPKMIENVNNLKVVLKMEGEEKKSTYTAITAKTIANQNVQR